MNGCDSDVLHSEVASLHVNEDRQSSVINDCAVSSEVRRAVDNLNESTPVSNNDVGEALGANDGMSLVGINGCMLTMFRRMRVLERTTAGPA